MEAVDVVEGQRDQHQPGYRIIRVHPLGVLKDGRGVTHPLSERDQIVEELSPEGSA